MRISKNRGLAATAGIAAFALLLSACGGDSSETTSPTDTPDGESTEEPTEEPDGDAEPVTLTVSVFGDGGFEDKGDAARTDLFRAYEDAFPHVTIQETNLGDGTAGRDATLLALPQGNAADVVMLEEGWRAAIESEYVQYLADLGALGAAELEGNFVDWKWAQGVDSTGKIFALGTDIGPQGLIYNATLVEEAFGIDNRDDFAAKLGGDSATWDQFFEVGAEFVANSDAAWYGVPAFLWNSFVNQQPEGYYTNDGELNVEGNAVLEEFLGRLVQADKDGLSAKVSAWEWANEDFHGKFAVHVAPGWMLGSVAGPVADGGDHVWDFADVFPGGATNWGGSFFGVSESSQQKEEAFKLAAWLTAPEQQVVAFQNAGAFPSSPQAQADPGVVDAANPQYNDAPIGQILAGRSVGVVAQFKGPQDSVIQDNVFGDIVNRINAGEFADGGAAWSAALTKLAEELG